MFSFSPLQAGRFGLLALRSLNPSGNLSVKRLRPLLRKRLKEGKWFRKSFLPAIHEIETAKIFVCHHKLWYRFSILEFTRDPTSCLFSETLFGRLTLSKAERLVTMEVLLFRNPRLNLRGALERKLFPKSSCKIGVEADLVFNWNSPFFRELLAKKTSSFSYKNRRFLLKNL